MPLSSTEMIYFKTVSLKHKKLQQSQNEKEIKGTESLSGEKNLSDHQNPNVKSARVLLPETLSKPN